MLEYLDSIEPGDNVVAGRGVKNFCLRNSGKGILVLITDLMDKNGYETALRYLLAQQMDVYVIHVLSPEELDPDVAGDLKLVDCEDADVAEITVSRPLLDRYQRTLGRVRRRGPRVLHAARHDLLDGQHRHAGRTAGHRAICASGGWCDE